MPPQLEDLSEDGRRDWRDVFLKALAESACVSFACNAAKVSRKRAYYHRDRCAKFRKKWEEAMEISTEMLELHVRRRAFREHSEDPAAHVLAIFLLKSHRPQKYRENPKDTGPSLEEIVASVVKHIPPESRQAVIDGLNHDLGSESPGSNGFAR